MISRLSLSNALRACACAGVLALPASAAGAEKIQVTVLTILASEKHADVNERIKEIAEEIQKKEPKLTGFKLERTTVQSIELGKCVTVKLIDKQTVDLCVDEKPDADGRAQLTIKPTDLGEITFTCKCGKFFPIVTQYQATDAKSGRKERLIIAVMAKPCPKAKN